MDDKEKQEQITDNEKENQSTMLGKLIRYSINFITVVGSLVSGFTALFYAAGFLAWNSRMVYLGMPEPEIVNINYLITGAKFFVFLPLRFTQGLRLPGWGWAVLPVIVFICAALIGIREHSKRFSKWTFYVTGITLLVILLIPLMKGAFLEYLPGLGEESALFTGEEPPLWDLRDNYSKLVVLTVFALVGTGLMLFWQRRIEEAISSSGTEAESSSEGHGEESKTKPERSLWSVMASRVGHLTSWKIASNVAPLLIAFTALLYILMLPMNYIDPVFAKRYPVVNVTFNQEGIYPGIQPTARLYLLKQEKVVERNLLLYSRDFYEIFQIKQEYIKELSIIGHEAIWTFD
jgi:hypothetical protein